MINQFITKIIFSETSLSTYITGYWVDTFYDLFCYNYSESAM